MIQRIQTLFLLVILTLSTILIFKPFAVVSNQTDAYLVSLTPGSLIGIIKPTIYGPMALNFIILILTIPTIVNFKNRRKQIKYSQIIMVLSTLLIGNIFLFHFIKMEGANVITHYTFYAFFPAVNIVMAFLARFFIKKDDKLVRSADRIR